MSVKIKVEQFEGPLDLLLQLIEGQELDITTLALAKVTEQFLDYVKQLQEKDPTLLADFLVIAAKLLVIKSKALLPNLELGIEEEESAYDLTQQLLIFKKYKEVAKYFRRMDLRRHQAWTREADFNDRITFIPDPQINPDVLANSIRKLANDLKEIVRLPQQVMAEVVSITEKIEHIQKLIADKIETSLSTLIKEAKSKTEVVVTFLALLELTKQRILTVEQNSIFEDIIIKKA
ncbi:MAG: segregation/condensation protein A [Candidatus Doudnabacteria bacterium]|nr:segregation/condensation protein A [Candidatus Doudnabacteria bacterium]